MNRSVRRITIALVFGALVAGCGSEPRNGDDPPVEALGPPKAGERFEDARERVIRALGTPDCEGLGRLIPIHRTEIDRDALCRTLDLQLGGAEPGASEAYAGGAVIDYHRDGAVVPVLLILDEDGRYRLSHVDPYVDRSAAETKRAPGLDGAARDAANALASRKCGRVREVVDPKLGIGAAPRETLCTYAEENPIAEIRRIDSDAEPVSLGGAATYGFFGIATPQVHYTMVLGRRPGPAGRRSGRPGSFAFVDAFRTNLAGGDE